VLLALHRLRSVLTTINAAIFTGARTPMRWAATFLAARARHWRDDRHTPANALLLQGAITLCCWSDAALTADGFNAMVLHLPVFWTFFPAHRLTLFVFGGREARRSASRLSGVPSPSACACVHAYSSFNYVRNSRTGRSSAAGAGGHGGSWRRHSAVFLSPKEMTLYRAALHRRGGARAPFRPRAEACFVVAADAVGGGEEARGGARPSRCSSAGPGEVSVTPAGSASSSRRSACWRRRAASGDRRRRRDPLAGRCAWARSTPSARTCCRS
jgi:hypothetical protein